MKKNITIIVAAIVLIVGAAVGVFVLDGTKIETTPTHEPVSIVTKAKPAAATTTTANSGAPDNTTSAASVTDKQADSTTAPTTEAPTTTTAKPADTSSQTTTTTPKPADTTTRTTTAAQQTAAETSAKTEAPDATTTTSATEAPVASEHIHAWVESVIAHPAEEHSEEWFRCDTCEAEFSDAEAMQAHVIGEEHGGYAAFTKTIVDKEAYDETSYKCECGETK